MLTIKRTRSPEVSLQAAMGCVRGDPLQTHYGIVQYVDGPAEIVLPPCAGAHLLLSGEVQAVHRQQTLAIAAGTLLIGEAGDRPQLRVPAQSWATLVHVFFAPRWLRPISPGARAETSLLPILHDPLSRSAAAFARLARGMVPLKEGAIIDSIEVNACLNALVAASDEYLQSMSRCTGHSRRHKRDVFVRMKWARDLILCGIEGAPTVETLAHFANVSPSHFIRQFRRIFGDPPYRYRLKHQMSHAHALLREGRLSVGEVMSRIGIESHCTFARAFRREFGVPASEVRSAAPAASQTRGRPTASSPPRQRSAEEASFAVR